MIHALSLLSTVFVLEKCNKKIIKTEKQSILWIEYKYGTESYRKSLETKMNPFFFSLNCNLQLYFDTYGYTKIQNSKKAEQLP